MKESIKVFVDAAKETPRLYFAPLVGAFQAVAKVASARMDRMERVALERHNALLEKLEVIVDRVGKLESVCALVLSHVSVDNATYVRMQRTIDELGKRVKELEGAPRA